VEVPALSSPDWLARLTDALAVDDPERARAQACAVIDEARDHDARLVRRLRILSRAPEDRVFTYTSRYSVNERIRVVCRRAGIPYKSPHLCGRHSFATNALARGASIREAMDAGDWKSSAVFLETYVHTANASRRVADRFNAIEFLDPHGQCRVVGAAGSPGLPVRRGAAS